MNTKTRFCVAVALAVLLPATYALAKPGDGKGNQRSNNTKSSRSSTNSSRNTNSGKSSQFKRDSGTNNTFKSNNNAPKRDTGQYQKKSSTPSRTFERGGQFKGGSGPNNTSKPNNNAPKRDAGQYQKKSSPPSRTFERGGQSKAGGGSPNNPNRNRDALKQYQQKGGTPSRTYGKQGDLKRDDNPTKRYQGTYDPKGGNTTQRYYRGSEFRKPGNNTGRDAAFMKHNFPSQYQNFNKDSKGGFTKDLSPQYRVNREGLEKLNRNNSFVKKHDIGGKSFNNHWTHHNNSWNRSNHNWYGNRGSHWNNNWGNRQFSWYPWSGWGGWGRWGYGYVLPAWNVGYYSSPYYGYNYYYTGAAPVYTTNYQAAAAVPPEAGANPTLAGPDEENEVTEQDAASAAAFADQGEIDFKAGNYHAAAKDWQHSLVDDPKNGAVMMLLAQALFAEGKFEEAAGATQAAMQMLPEDKWGVVVGNYAQLYGNVQDYTEQLRTLEEARTTNPDSPALRFLLGYQFGYLNYPKQAVRELDKALTMAPRDLGSRKVREIFAAQWPEAPPLPAAVLEAENDQPGATPAAPPAGPAAAPGPSDAKPEDKVGTPS